jgi:peptidyl-prolyl cis-trans isomerase D
MAKEKEQKKKVVTKKDVSRVSREQRQRKWIVLSAAIVFASVLGVIIFGLLYELVLQGRQAVATVNGEKITISEFQKEVRYQRFQSVRTYESYYQIYEALGAEMGQSFLSGLQQIQYRLSEEYQVLFGEEVVQQMIDNESIAQYAEENGITVSQAEIDEELQSAFGYYPDGTPTPEPTITPFSTSTLTSEQLSLVSPTPEIVPTEESTAEEAVPTVAEVPAEDEEEDAEAAGTQQAENAVTPEAELTSTPTLEPLPTETPYTLEGYQDNLKALVDQLREIGLSQDYLELKFRQAMLREKVFEAVTADIESVQEQVWARHILVESEGLAQEVLQKLEAGEDWSELAAEYSTDDSNKMAGGDLGWFIRGSMVAPFDEAAFNLEVGEVSDPVETQFGWHIIQVLGHEVRPVNANVLEQTREQRFAEWLEGWKEQANIEVRDNWQAEIPTTPTIPPGIRLDF